MIASKHFIPNFEMHSVLLIAAFALMASAAAGSHAQVPSAASPNSPPSQMSTAAPAAIPANRTTAKDLDAAFDRADANHDGRLDREEAEHFPAVAQRFELIDTNRDSYISREEFKKAAGS